MKKIIKKNTVILIVFCYLILIGISFLRPMILKVIMDEGIIKKNIRLIIYLSLSLTALISIEEVTSILQSKLFADFQNKFVLSLYIKVGQILYRAKQDYFTNNSSTEIINKLSTDINSVSTLMDSNIMYVLGYVLQIISGVIGLFVINWKLAFLIIIVVPIKYLLIKFFSEKAQKLFEKEIDLSSKFSAWFGDIINGIREVKLWNLYEEKQKNLITKQKEILLINKKCKSIQAYNMSTDSAIKGLITAFLYGIGGYLICKSELTLGSLTAFITYSNYVINPLSVVMNLKFIFAQIKPSADRLRNFFKTDMEQTKGNDICQLKKQISFENVSFCYDNGKMVLENINLKIEKGEKIAIIGDNGSGKSTLISMLLRFIEPQKGHIYIDGVDVKKYDMDQYRNLFSVVEQHTYLFEDTLWNNIVMGKNVLKEEMNESIKNMNMQEFITKLPGGYDYKIQKNGENFSGGERQKISLLRAIVKNSSILILDEATSNIDEKFDEFLYQYILREFSDKTIIIITHNKKHLKWMDKTYFIQNGSIEEYNAL